MLRGVRLLPAGIEENQFYPVPTGWLFTTASPWILGPRRTYLLSEEQKPALAALVRRSRYIRALAVVPLLLLVATAFVVVPSLMDTGSIVTWMVYAAFGVVTAFAMTLSDHLTIGPLLRELARSAQRVAIADRLQRQSTTLSGKALACFTAVFVAGGVANIYTAVTAARGGAFAAIAALVFGILAIAFGSMLILKLRQDMGGEDQITNEYVARQIKRLELSTTVLAVTLFAVSLFGGLAVGMLFYGKASHTDFVMRNRAGDIVARLTTGTDGLPSLTLSDAEKRERVAIGLRREGDPYLLLKDTKGNLRWSAVLGSQGPFLALSDNNDKVRWSAGVDDLSSYLRLMDSTGKMRWSVSVDEVGGRVRNFDASGREAAPARAP